MGSWQLPENTDWKVDISGSSGTASGVPAWHPPCWHVGAPVYRYLASVGTGTYTGQRYDACWNGGEWADVTLTLDSTGNHSPESVTFSWGPFSATWERI